MYNKIDVAIINKLKSISGDDSVITDSDDLKIYSKDYTENLSFCPEVIIKPHNTKEVSEIIKLANELNIPVVPRGGGTGLSGGALAIYGGICLSMELFKKIIETHRDIGHIRIPNNSITTIQIIFDAT